MVLEWEEEFTLPVSCPRFDMSISFIRSFFSFYNVFKLQIYYLGKQLSFLVDCKWGNWTFGECSSSCGGGIRLDTRQELIHATNGGNECTGPSNLTENCNIQECPGKKKFFLCNSNLVWERIKLQYMIEIIKTLCYFRFKSTANGEIGLKVNVQKRVMVAF